MPASAVQAAFDAGHALTPNTVELIPTLGALFPRGVPVPTVHAQQTWIGRKFDYQIPAGGGEQADACQRGPGRLRCWSMPTREIY